MTTLADGVSVLNSCLSGFPFSYCREIENVDAPFYAGGSGISNLSSRPTSKGHTTVLPSQELPSRWRLGHKDFRFRVTTGRREIFSNLLIIHCVSSV